MVVHIIEVEPSQFQEATEAHVSQIFSSLELKKIYTTGSIISRQDIMDATKKENMAMI